jgi:UDP-N-acetylmuramate dehydrogenase
MNLSEILEHIAGIELYENCNLEKYTTIRLNKVGSIVIVKEVEALKSLTKVLAESDIKFHLIGWGANQIIHNTEKTLFIKLKFEFNRNYFSEVKEFYELPASVPLNTLTSHAMKFGLKGWEVFTGIPASLGGAIFMNAGTSLGEIGNLVKSVKILTETGLIRDELITKDSFSYRKNHFVKKNEIIISAVLEHNGLDLNIRKEIKEYLSFRKSSQPLTSKNCGCVFENYDSLHKAGQFIDVCGLKGLGLNGLSVSHKHANFIENENASTEDFIRLSESLKYQLELFSGIQFELEAKVY